MKYDGCHCILVKRDGKAWAFTRQGEVVLAAMDHVLRELERIPDDNFVLFAEAWNEWEEHSIINGTFRRSYLAEDAKLLEAVVWDYVPLEDFEAGHCPVRYKTRRDRVFEIVHACMRHRFADGTESDTPLRVAYAAETTEGCDEHISASRDLYGAEFPVDGFIRKDRNGLWTAGAGSDGAVVKIKDHLSIDIEVVSVFEGKGKFVGMVGGLVCKWEGMNIKIGGGKLTDKERKLYWDFPNLIIGKIVEAHGLGQTPDGHLREGRFIRLREDKTEGE
ncbi:DNA ligase [Pseudomonas phage VSW-3]|uniref:DNA ligase n=1 Tax=Pseudomonas phage VSW-3 TaxID=1852562 RepID=A0A173GCU2_9CAUD|nr:DNA ligase [Pseudomonas phage VSW-3]ANH51090.1 DNA ligase [Pseudomonas phage VSW-3]